MTTPRPKYPDDDQPLTKGEARDSFLKWMRLSRKYAILWCSTFSPLRTVWGT